MGEQVNSSGTPSGDTNGNGASDSGGGVPGLLFRPSDFQSLEWSFEIQNLTSRQAFDPRFFCRVQEILDRGLVLSVPLKSCAVGHQLSLYFIVRLPADLAEQRRVLSMRATAKVEELDVFDSESAARIQFLQFDELVWQEIQGCVADRQREISAFFEAVKGEAG